jgi:hypothetical protein
MHSPGTTISQCVGRAHGEKRGVLSAEYYLKQAETAARLALAESDPAKAQAMHILALEFYDKADKARTELTPTAYQALRTITG